MNKLQLLTDLINRMVKDKRLSTSHLSLSIALCHGWIDSGFNESYQISRRRMMSLSHIHSIATYHSAYFGDTVPGVSVDAVPLSACSKVLSFSY